MVQPLNSIRKNEIYSCIDISPINGGELSPFLDQIQSGQEVRSVSFEMFNKIKSFFKAIYFSVIHFFRSIFAWCGWTRKSDPVIDSFKRDSQTLDEFLPFFSNKSKIENIRLFKSRWKKAFEFFHHETRHLLLLEDVMSWAPQNTKDIEQWAEENYTKQNKLSRQFILELEPISNGEGATSDPFEYIPTYIQNVKEKLQGKINA